MLQELRVLECRGCALTKIDDMFHLLPHLTHLDVGNNLIKSIVQQEFRDLPNLRILKLDFNKISSIDADVFAVQTELRKINLAKNKIKHVDKNSFRNAINITDIDLGYNNIEYLDKDVFLPVANTLHKLVLSGNYLKIGNLIELLRTLEVKELYLAEMGLVHLPPNVLPDSTSILNLAGNHLSSLSVLGLPLELRELDISKNRLRGLNDAAVRRIEVLDRVKLEGNPWSCDLCHIVPLLERANRSSVIREIKCASPYTAEGKLLGDVRYPELTWCNAATYESGDASFFLTGEENGFGLIAAGGSVMLLFLAVVAILAVVCYSRRHAAKYYTHEDKLSAERDSIFDNNQSPLFGDDRELCFKFPLSNDEKRISVSTIDEIKKEHGITNGT